MNQRTSFRPVATFLALACVGGMAFAQAAATSPGPKTENTAEKAWDKTKGGAEKAWDATKSGTKKAARATGKAVDKVATGAADGTRKVGNKIGEKLPGTAQNEAAKKP